MTDGKYVVPYKHSTYREPKERLHFSNIRSFNDLEQAIEFAEAHLPALVLQRLPLKEAAPEQHYILVTEYWGKYRIGSFDEFEAVKNYEAIRCSRSEIEKWTEQLTHEPHFSKLYRGLEVKLI